MALTHRVRLLALCTLARAASGVRSVLVTGANKGIGRAIVQKIVEDYDDVHVFLGCRSAQRGEEAAAAIASAVPGCADRLSVLPLDVADDTSVAAAAAWRDFLSNKPSLAAVDSAELRSICVRRSGYGARDLVLELKKNSSRR